MCQPYVHSQENRTAMDVIFPMQWGPHDRQCVKAPMEQFDITFMILLTFKTQLGFAGGITCTTRNDMAGM
jgi:hypothetical protein